MKDSLCEVENIWIHVCRGKIGETRTENYPKIFHYTLTQKEGGERRGENFPLSPFPCGGDGHLQSQLPSFRDTGERGDSLLVGLYSGEGRKKKKKKRGRRRRGGNSMCSKSGMRLSLKRHR